LCSQRDCQFGQQQSIKIGAIAERSFKLMGEPLGTPGVVVHAVILRGGKRGMAATSALAVVDWCVVTIEVAVPVSTILPASMIATR
jgi:hypothetical protein